MKVTAERRGGVCTLAVEGKIDTLGAPELEKEVTARLPGCDKMIFDFSGVDYITSAGLRVLVLAQRELMKRDGVVVTGVSPDIENILKVTGLNKVLTVK